MRRGLPIVAALLFGSAAAPASAAELLDGGVNVPRAVDTSCTGSLRPAGDGVAHRSLTAPAAGYLTARLQGSGEWDLAVFRRGGASEPVAGSTYMGAREVAAGYVRAGDDLVVQACRRAGADHGARVSAELEEIETPEEPQKLRLVRVSTPTDERKAELVELELDLTEHGGPGFVDVVVHGDDDASTLRQAGFTYKNVETQRTTRPSNRVLPSGRTTYRRLFEITSELTTLANGNTDIVKPITLAHSTGEGRPIQGLEITTDPNARDGKPAFLLVGMHHAREWPAADIQMEWARQLINDYRASSARAVNVVRNVRTIIVPVTNADGYNNSRERGQTNGHASGDTNFVSSDNEYRRKNCRTNTGGHSCHPTLTPPTTGVDDNRNYSAFFGGVGSSTVFTSENFRGSGPFSEPETQSIRELISSRQVVAMITTHTFGRTILRQPGVDSEPPTPDEALYKQLGDSLGAANGYHSQYSKDLYDHGGTTDAWHYFVTGGLGFVFEMNNSAFHPPHSEFVAEWDGTIAGANGGNREALYRITEFAANPTGHAVLRGSGPPGAVLRVARDTVADTQEGPDVPEHLESAMVIPGSGQFEWHVNQSTSPFAVKAGQTQTWTLTCENPEGTVVKSQSVFVARGQALTVDPCTVPPAPGGGGTGQAEPLAPPPSDKLEQPGLRAKTSASFNGRVYTVRVKGSLLDVADLDGLSAAQGTARCAGFVQLTVTATRRRIARGRAPVDGECGFERAFRVKRSKLPRALRRRRPRTVTAVATWGGNQFLLGARDDASARIKTRRR